MPPDAVIEDRLRGLGATVSGWSNGPGERYVPHDHGYDKILVVVHGAITFALPSTDEVMELRAGDRLDLPAGTKHAATVGESGVRCIEAHLQVARLGSPPRRVAGWALGVRDPGTSARIETADGIGT
jgi:quercetin dioxygenase-like cupin family protein